MGTFVKIALLVAAVAVLGGAAASVAIYGSARPCRMLATARARDARDSVRAAATSAPSAGPRDMAEAAAEARRVMNRAGRARADASAAMAAARESVRGMGAGACSQEMWHRWF